LDGQIKEQLSEIEKLKADLEKNIKNGKLLAEESLKLRQRIQRIKNKRFRIEDN
jgi:regulator of replication initiation timing